MAKVNSVELWQNMSIYEQDLWQKGYQYIAGTDEAGRGPLAGPVTAAAVILSPQSYIEGLNDSKKLSETKRDKLAIIIKEQALAYAIISIEPNIIDQINILEASRLAMVNAINSLKIKPDFILSDALNLPLDQEQLNLIKGDQKSVSIAAASILAKTERDRLMLAYDRQYPQYQFAKHKGYPTALHRALLKEHGASPIHRNSFKVRSND